MKDHPDTPFFLDVEVLGHKDMGMIVQVPPWCSNPSTYKSKLIKIGDNRTGEKFGFLVIKKGFALNTVNWEIQRTEWEIEKIITIHD